jgi:hypothetical protein
MFTVYSQTQFERICMADIEIGQSPVNIETGQSPEREC